MKPLRWNQQVFIYWSSLYEVLEQYGFEIRVVNACHVKHVPGRTKTDTASACSMDPFALISRFAKPRTYMRLRDNLVFASTQAVHHMHKALFEMNVRLSNVINDIAGETGLHIIEAIIAGERDPKQLAALCSTRIKSSSALFWVCVQTTPSAAEKCMFVRICPYLPVSARVCLSQHHWLANRMRTEGIDFKQCSNAFLKCLIRRGSRLGGFLDCPRSTELFQRAALDELSQRLLDANRTIGQPNKITTIFGRRVTKYYKGSSRPSSKISIHN